MSLADKLNKAGYKPTSKRREPLWKGPEQDGITFSLLSRFLVCRERFRVRVVEGLGPAERFNHRIHYGNLWHTCEEAVAAGVDPLRREPQYPGATELSWGWLLAAATGLAQRFPLQREEVLHWYNVCKTQWPIYIDFWEAHQERKKITPLLSEYKFAVPYQLPSGRKVLLRGKFDSVDIIEEETHSGLRRGIYLQENKTKGDIDETTIVQQLTFDLQTMLYIIALQEIIDTDTADNHVLPYDTGLPLLGVRYNVIRRPLSGGRGTIRQHKPSKSNPRGESKEEFYGRLAEVIREEPETYFMRWEVDITPQDIAVFKQRSLDPILESLCSWWDYVAGDGKKYVTGRPNVPSHALHYRMPYGVYNPLIEAGSTDLDEYLRSGSEVGLVQLDNLFPELE